MKLKPGDKVIVVIPTEMGRQGGYSNGDIGVIESVKRYTYCYSVNFDEDRETFGVDYDEVQPYTKLHKVLE